MKAVVFLALLLAGCHTAPPAPQIQYKTEVINTSCTTFKIIQIPETDLPKLSRELKADILAHDKAWVSACRK